MSALKTVLTSVFSIIELFILTKIMGKRQMSQLSLFDYINGITIGSISAEMACSPIEDCWKPAIAVAIYGLFAVCFSLLSNKSIVFRRFFVGKSIILMDNGTIYRKNLAKSKLDLNEFLEQCRINGYFNLDDLQTVFMEANGELSFLPKSELRPANPRDLGISPAAELPSMVVISDGNIIQGNLKACGKNEIWLRKQLKEQKCNPIENIFLATCDTNGSLSVFKNTDECPDKDMFN